jgi:hypothetical protein
MKELLEDYQRRLVEVNKLIDEDWQINNDSINSIKRKTRLETKASCFRTFITELEREIKRREDTIKELECLSLDDENPIIPFKNLDWKGDIDKMLDNKFDELLDLENDKLNNES